jgi:transcriptional regulator with XRE-family HTH domain
MTVTHAEFLALLADRAKREGSQRKLAAKFGMSVAFLSAVLRGRKQPGPRLLAKMGYESMTVYRAAQTHDTLSEKGE